MKKGIIAVVGLVIAAGASTGVFFAVKNDNDRKEAEKAAELSDNQLFRIDADSVENVSIHGADGDFSIVLDGEKWVNEPSSGNTFDINQTALQGICTTFCSLDAYKNYGEADSEAREKYGLSDPYVISLSDGKDSYKLEIGDASPTGGYYYATVEGRNKIYAILSTDADTLISSRYTLIDNNLVPYDDADIVGISVKKDGKVTYELDFDKTNGLWSLPGEYDMLTVNQTRPSTLTTLLTRLQGEQVLEEKLDDLSKYGFDKPYAEFTVKGADGSERTMLLSRYGKDSATYTHVYTKETGVVATYYTSDLDFVDYSIYSLITQTVECASFSNVAEFEFSCAETSDKFTVSEDGSKATVREGQLDLEKAEVINMFRNFYNMFSYISITGVDLDAQPKLEDPVLSAKYKLKDGSETSFDLVSTGNDSECYVFVNGKYTGTTTNTDFISGANSMMSAYELVCAYAGIEPA